MSKVIRVLPVNVISVVLLFAPLALLGEWLIRHTHHRPLGAATFASFSLLLWLAFQVGTSLVLFARERKGISLQGTRYGLLLVGVLASGSLLIRALL